jgi:hypothetical protein
LETAIMEGIVWTKKPEKRRIQCTHHAPVFDAT